MADTDDALYSTFDKAEDFFSRLDTFLTLDLTQEPESPEQQQQESFACIKLQLILGEYQEQAFLLDPYLERMVTPPANLLRQHAGDVVNEGAKWSASRLGNLADLIYAFCRVRGHKTIVRFFPHEVTDLPVVIAYLSLEGGPVSRSDRWNLRYVMLLWLSLICMIPFDLHRFDDPSSRGRTSALIEKIGHQYLGYAGIERDIAATMLARLYARKDTHAAFQQFLEGLSNTVTDSDQLFTALGGLRVVCEYCKYASSENLAERLQQLRKVADASISLENNSTVRKLRVKLMSRIALKLLPPPKLRRRRARALMSNSDTAEESISGDVNQQDVAEEVEAAVSDILQSLEDKDTLIRWSSSKALARLAERLPRDFSDQILEQVLGMFSEHSWASSDEMLDLPPVAEFQWHGACLACAEFTRRDLISSDQLYKMIPWIIKSLHFDIRKGTYSVGSSVRDAAAYVLWSLARSQDIGSIQSFAEDLARELVVTSLYDREVHIRRAASAAFQENVGRMGLFPEGISVLAKIDFFAVGVRRNAFTVAAADVAKVAAYRSALHNHLLNVVLRHWDGSMRQLGAESLRAVCSVDPEFFGPQTLRALNAMLTSVDIFSVNGALLGLSELARMYAGSTLAKVGDRHFEIFSSLRLVPESMLRSRQNDLVLEGYCLVVLNSVSESALGDNSDKNAPAMPQWRSVIEQSLRSRSTSVQEAAAQAMRRVSQLKDCASDVKRFIRDFGGAAPVLQQGIARTLGAISYDCFPHCVVDVIQCLQDAVDSEKASFSRIVETRQQCYEAFPKILTTLGPKVGSLEPSLLKSIYRSLIRGLDDYTSDQRGDIGSWIRISCISSLTSVTRLLFSLRHTIDIREYLIEDEYHSALGGILKQGVERLDNVRAHAGEQLLLLIGDTPKDWEMDSIGLFTRLFLSEDERSSWADASYIFPKAVHLLSIVRYRSALTHGLVLSIGSKTDSTQRPASTAILDYALTLPLVSSHPPSHTLLDLLCDVIDLGKRNFSSNHIAVPVLQTLGVLLESDIPARLESKPEGLECLMAILTFATRSADKLKNIQRILVVMKIVCALLPVRAVFRETISALPTFLGHRFPKVRAETAETLYIITQTRDLDNLELEEVLLETEWMKDVDSEVHRVVQLLSDM